MVEARRHLRGGVCVWLVCHALTFSAVVPRDCCAAHSHDAAPAAPACHELAAAEPPAADGATCPMHRPARPGAANDRLAGTCDAPAAALAAVLLHGTAPHGPLELPLVQCTAVMAAWPPSGPRRSLSLPPDAPPPRA